MKVVVAMDSFKGCLSSMEAGNAVRDGIHKADPTAEVMVRPLADGGEGTAEMLVSALGGRLETLEVQGPLEDKVTATYGIMEESHMAIIEMASAAGIVLVGEDRRPLDTTTYGVGELIEDAMKKGCRNFIIGIGGSATNDGGVGMLQALGYEFLDDKGNQVPRGAKGLLKISSIHGTSANKLLKECKFNIGCDVTNPLCGENGATYVFGSQKGVTEEMQPVLDLALSHYSKKTEVFTGNNYSDCEGAGAAGGLGFAFLSYLHGRLQSGTELVLSSINLEDSMNEVDYVVTGEGKLDAQTAMGKGPIGVARMAKSYGATTIALAGSIGEGAENCLSKGLDAYFSIMPQAMTIEDAMKPQVTIENLQKTSEQIFRLICAK